MSDATRADILKSIEPRSDQLNADDLVTGPITVTITKVSRGDREQPIVVDLEGYDGRPYKPCKTMRRIMVAVFSDDAKAWIGQQMTLYNDPEVVYAGVKVGGIRISHISGITEPRVFIMTLTRGKKREITIEPIEQLSAIDREYIENTTRDIATIETEEELKAVGFVLKEKPKAVQDALRPAYTEKQEELKGRL